MNISPRDNIAGIPILDARRLMRWARARPFDSWGLELVRNCLGLSAWKAQNLVSALRGAGYIEVDPSSPHPSSWRLTVKGYALANAKATKPLTRETAERKLSEFMDRVRHVNSSHDFLYKVKKVVLFGSYRTSRPRIGDIDLTVEYGRKIGNREEFERLMKEKVEQAYQNGRIFRSYSDELEWPEREVRLYLKSRSRAISVHSINDRILDEAPQEVIYDDHN